MLTDQELKELYEDIESDRVERKQSAADPKKIQQAICAFANDMPGHKKPGVLFIGVKDDGSCMNLPIDDKLLLNLSQLRSTGNILPLPSLIVQKKTINGCEVAIVIVEPSRLPPVRFKGRSWIRVGPRRDTATREEEQRLTERRRAGNLPWDMQPISSATLDDLDLDLFRNTYLPSAIAPQVIAENKRTIEQQLRSLRFLDADEVTPTVAGLLTLGKSPADFLPGAYLQFVKINGTKLSDPVASQRAIHGPISELIRKSEETVEANIEIETDFKSAPTEIRVPDYPIVAIQQLLRNAIMHRSYETTNAPTRLMWFSDRVEILSPGGPYGAVTIENFGRPGEADYRNPTIAEVMRNLGFVQKFGAGIQSARDALTDNGSPPLELTPQSTFVSVTLRKRT
ncbi:ATP-binding protein [Rhodopirellula sp. P2]|uniref:ATP-binding protein n=1 Tax=Rhodopirellula sp. P2 TaxID=2127060 RepID=UPI002367495B|nr:ATP-binding protein [Rhodopirellula sp. P2]WDQ14574.1 ATP-binding protein [Rhodopirellula sp. P2]